eukprot:3310515-Prymnesium_polylepis.1
MPQPSRRHLAAVLPAAGCGCACRRDAIAKRSWCTGEGFRRGERKIEPHTYTYCEHAVHGMSAREAFDSVSGVGGADDL